MRLQNEIGKNDGDKMVVIFPKKICAIDGLIKGRKYVISGSNTDPYLQSSMCHMVIPEYEVGSVLQDNLESGYKQNC